MTITSFWRLTSGGATRGLAEFSRQFAVDSGECGSNMLYSGLVSPMNGDHA
jgi:hypothetical protein